MGINCGNCHEFAEDVLRLAKIGKIKLVENGCHSVIKYKGKYYDSEIPNGVDSIEDIPYVRRSNINPVQT
jgi:hypothetical protein